MAAPERPGPTDDRCPRGPSRRALVAAAAAAGAFAALPAWPERARAAGTGDGADPSPVLDPHPATEPSGTHVRRVGSTGVVFQYGAVLPSFDGWRTREPTRGYLPLDGRWRFRFDPDATGLDAGWNSPTLDDTGWRRAEVPGTWDLLDTPEFAALDGAFGKGTAFTDGYAWYRTTVAVPASWRGRHVRLNFLGVGYSANVWLDGVHLGKHEGASSAFSLPLGGAVRPGTRQTLAVRVFRRAGYRDYAADQPQAVTDDREIPYKPVDYWPYAGITRPAWLEAVPQVTVAKVLADAGDGELRVHAVLENHGSADFTGRLTVDPGAGSRGRPVTVAARVPARSVGTVPVTVRIPHAPRWSPHSPHLLTARAELADAAGHRVDTLTTGYGVRTVSTGGARLRINGEPVFLKGLNWHEETADSGRAMAPHEYDAELGRVLDLGANFVRNCVYTRHPRAYDWADRNGVLVMDEIDTMWLNTAQEKSQTDDYGLARALALAMAWNQHNHPSVILWSLQNESEIDSGGAPVYRAWLADLKAAVRSVDLSARPVTWASNTSNDPAFDLADVVGFNEYFGYFYGKDADLGTTLDAVHAKYPDKPLLITENGTWAIAGTRGPQTTEGTEEWQAASLRAHWSQVAARAGFVAGYTYWLLKDYKERDGYNQEYNGVSVMGLESFDRSQRKLAYQAYQQAALPEVL